MVLAQVIEKIYPEFQFFREYEIHNEGHGDFIKVWNSEKPRPSQELIESTWESIEAQEKQDAINKEALEYLSSTDWYVIRKQETDIDIPVDISIEREAARNSIV